MKKFKTLALQNNLKTLWMMFATLFVAIAMVIATMQQAEARHRSGRVIAGVALVAVGGLLLASSRRHYHRHYYYKPRVRRHIHYYPRWRARRFYRPRLHHYPRYRVRKAWRRHRIIRRHRHLRRHRHFRRHYRRW